MSNDGGVKHDADKPMMALIPARAEIEEAKVWTFGAKKYSENNWRKGFPFTRILSAMHRHYTAYKSGQTLDPETGISHMAHIRCCAGMLLEFEVTHPDKDDRQCKIEKTSRHLVPDPKPSHKVDMVNVIKKYSDSLEKK